VAWIPNLASTVSTEPAVRYRPEDLKRAGTPPSSGLCHRLNYAITLRDRMHATPGIPSTFTKYLSCLTGPTGTIALTGSSVDWEVELVVVIGAEARNVAAADASDYVAGVDRRQDFSDREYR